MNARRVKLHELYREVEALGGAAASTEDEAYNGAINDVLAILRASGFGEGFYVDQREYENRARVSRAVQMEAAQ
ncbi:hypothetical protein I7F13_27440 [Sinorhizobium meliloti]|uniref:hypothetical protein n=1 Tax=Rhizobium meliloti TaxID=382 RepID=UPI000FD7267E|nr:hypothetical protein [Sinorhizobium meliloti]MDE3825887.1 hypothetical protein [Sinorhizobium meliloti]RVH87171.1 hypothetical protein CN204_06180 [Sinorhizobium meliloti]RVM29308.1 hypothetical protein CN132_09350 [Sinorhizobium meliloti]RVM43461.1 hypothetical protein CN127_26025 [Sinorhizobium meliloti]RVN67602.1 hypothetical protein CN106_16315 [Sinorhizobium meliloti]